jgi:hypothetical protein
LWIKTLLSTTDQSLLSSLSRTKKALTDAKDTRTLFSLTLNSLRLEPCLVKSLTSRMPQSLLILFGKIDTSPDGIESRGQSSFASVYSSFLLSHSHSSSFALKVLTDLYLSTLLLTAKKSKIPMVLLSRVVLLPNGIETLKMMEKQKNQLPSTLES